MKPRKYKAGRLFNKFLKLTLGSYMRLLFDYRIDNGQLAGLKPPYIVLANHTNFWDPFLLSMCIPEPVYFVTSDAYFRNPVLKRLLKLVGAIPKTKNVSDPLSIRGILEVARAGGVIGIFPEGKRNWDGRTLPLLRPTAKLIKSLGVPVVSVLFRGACLSMPRWSVSTRKGELSMAVSRVLEPEAIRQLSAEEIYRIISESLAFDEYEHQRKHRSPYTGSKKAEKLELFLFGCPECGALGRLRSAGDRLRCGNCSYEVLYNTYGFFETDGGKLHFDNPADWNSWQLGQLDSLAALGFLSRDGSPAIADSGIFMKTGGKTGSLKLEASGGTLLMHADRLEFHVENKKLQSFPLHDIIGENVQFNDQLEFISGKTLYRFGRRDRTFSAYKWVMAITSARNPALRRKQHGAAQTEMNGEER